MYDPFFVRRPEGFRNLKEEGQRFIQRHWSSGDSFCQCGAFDKLHDEEIDPIVGTDVVECANMRVIQLRNHFGLAFKTISPSRIFRNVFGKYFDRNNTPKPSIARSVYL